MAVQLLKQEDLLEWTGYSRQADLEKFLRQNRIPYTYGKANQVCTTQAAIDTVMTPADNVEEVSF